jgi:glutamate-1-semialdehyde 2,1-aminomutase
MWQIGAPTGWYRSPVDVAAVIDPSRLEALEARENARFVAERPVSTALFERSRRTMPRGVPVAWMDDLYEHPPVFVAHGRGATITDVDDHSYLDMYVADMSAFCGHAPDAVVKAVSRRMALGNQFLMPGEDAIVVAEHLADRYGLPKWQFTLSATQANTEVIRLARAATGREIILLFDGKYHGHGDATLVVLEDGQVRPEEHGLPRSITGQARIIGFNDVDALEAALAPRDVALVLAEPAMTNAGFILPDAGYHDALRRLTRDAGTLLAIDETHSLVTAYGGLTRAYGLEPDMLTVGKSIAAGVPLGAYGMTEEIASHIAPPPRGHLVSGEAIDQVSTGGTLFANALSMAAGRAALVEVMTRDAFGRSAELGERMANGLRAAIKVVGLPWTVVQYGAHAAYFFAATAPRNGAESRASDDPQLRAVMRVWLANRGVWESGWWLGPTVSLAHTVADVDHYVERFGQCLADLVASGPVGA